MVLSCEGYARAWCMSTIRRQARLVPLSYILRGALHLRKGDRGADGVKTFKPASRPYQPIRTGSETTSSCNACLRRLLGSTAGHHSHPAGPLEAMLTRVSTSRQATRHRKDEPGSTTLLCYHTIALRNTIALRIAGIISLLFFQPNACNADIGTHTRAASPRRVPTVRLHAYL